MPKEKQSPGRARVSVGVWQDDHEVLCRLSNPNMGRRIPDVIHEALVLAGFAPEGTPCPRCEKPLPKVKVARAARCTACAWPEEGDSRIHS
jgi:hypothetical protein